MHVNTRWCEQRQLHKTYEHNLLIKEIKTRTNQFSFECVVDLWIWNMFADWQQPSSGKCEIRTTTSSSRTTTTTTSATDKSEAKKKKNTQSKYVIDLKHTNTKNIHGQMKNWIWMIWFTFCVLNPFRIICFFLFFCTTTKEENSSR